jgi:hypothetical protein
VGQPVDVVLDETEPEALAEPTPIQVKKSVYHVPKARVRAATKEQLKGWTPPKGAYVLFEVMKKKLLPGGAHKVEPGLLLILLEHRPRQSEAINRVLREKPGARVIDYGNFPSLNDPSPARRRQAKMHTGPDGVCDYTRMEHFVAGLIARENSPDAQLLQQIKAVPGTEELIKKHAEKHEKELQKRRQNANKNKQNEESDSKGSQKSGGAPEETPGV